jgi:cobalt/nickel transport system permease protein
MITLARSLLSILTLVLFVSTTRFPALLSELRRLKVPSMVIEVLAFLYRYFFVLIDEMEHMRLAVKARSAGSGKRSVIRALSGLLGMLFIRSYERSERIYMAMQLRGYNRDGV